MTIKAFSWTCSLVAALTVPAVSQAASMSYPGPVHVAQGFYDNIEETSITDPVPLYGPPVVGVGNSITFSPTTFMASVSTHASDITSGALEFTFTADPGTYIQSLSLFETGTWSITGDAGVTAGGGLIVTYFDELTQTFVSIGEPIHTTVPPADDFPLMGPGNGTWFGSALIDLEAMDIVTDHVIVTLDNNLIASSCGCGEATITKDSVTINVSVVPEPASLALMAAGTVLIVRKRRN